MKYIRYVDTEFNNETVYTEPIEISPRYSGIEFVVQRTEGNEAFPFNAQVQGAQKTNDLTEDSWANLMDVTDYDEDTNEGNKAFTLGLRQHSWNFYRCKLTCDIAGDMTVRFTVIGVR